MVAVLTVLPVVLTVLVLSAGFSVGLIALAMPFVVVLLFVVVATLLAARKNSCS